MIKNVIFDLGGVLLNLDMPGCMKRFEILGMDVKGMMGRDTKKKGAVLCDGITASGITELYQVGELSTEDFLSQTKDSCAPGTTLDEVEKAWHSCLLDLPEYKLDYVLELRRRGYHTYLLSNTNESHWEAIVKRNFPLPVETYFERAFLSQEMHIAKPDPAIYLSVLEQIGCKAEECLFIDDSATNTDAASALGFHTMKCPTEYDWRNDIEELLN